MHESLNLFLHWNRPKLKSLLLKGRFLCGVAGGGVSFVLGNACVLPAFSV